MDVTVWFVMELLEDYCMFKLSIEFNIVIEPYKTFVALEN